MVISHPCDEKHFFPLACGKETWRVMPLERLKKPRKSLPSFSASIRYGICDAHLREANRAFKGVGVRADCEFEKIKVADGTCASVTGANKGIGLEICRQSASAGFVSRDEKGGVEAVENLKASGLSRVVFHQLDVKEQASIASCAKFIEAHFGELDILFINNERAKAVLENEKIDEVLEWFLRDFNEQKLEANGWPKTVSAYKASKAAVNAYTKLIAKRFPQHHINSIHPGRVKTEMT
ncbi:(+)-neomenthol dehydrogenase [Quercus suber]|uniref:(+)-neomenthol dehydrogenase n=1 Tax=Quercus suber TaxID=58331 RepID=A0AAW0LY32_QUESU